MQLQLSEHDRMLCDRFIADGIFEELNPRDIPQADGVIAVVCSDCDRFREAMQNLEALSLAWRTEPRTHVFALNGGALWLAEDPYASAIPIDLRAAVDAPKTGIAEAAFRFILPNGQHFVASISAERIMDRLTAIVLLSHIKKAQEMKGIETLLLNVHFPCGIARHYGWDLGDVARNVLLAENVVRKCVANECELPIVPICRVPTAEGREQPFRVNRERFAAWNAQ